MVCPIFEEMHLSIGFDCEMLYLEVRLRSEMLFKDFLFRIYTWARGILGIADLRELAFDLLLSRADIFISGGFGQRMKSLWSK